jgi:hypothetical protein
MSKQKTHINRFFRLTLLLFALTFLTESASAQLNFESIKKILGLQTEEPAEGENADSTQVEKVRKPLESYFFSDSVRSRLAFAWEVRPGYNQVRMREIDTLLDRFEVDYPFMRPDVGSIYLGNLGGAAMRFNYVERPNRQDFTFLNAYDDYLMTPERAPYFNVKRPFTNLSWWMSGQSRRAEEQLRITHAQNISPSTGFNLHYLNRGTRGMYIGQRAKDKNLSLAVSHTGKKYSLHTGYVYNIGEIRENGGIRWDADLANPELIPDAISVRLSDLNSGAYNEFKSNTFYINQAYGIPLQRVSDVDLSIADKSSVFVGHSFEYTAAHRIYTDLYNQSLFKRGDPDGPDYAAEEPASYYDHWFVNPVQSLDSLRESRIDNKVFIQIQPWNRDGIIGTIDAGIGHAMHRYYMESMHREYIYTARQQDKKNDSYLYGSVQGKFRKYMDWNGRVEYHLVGFRSQDIRIDAQVQLSAYLRERPITLTFSGYMDNRTPDYWMNRFASNHFIWNNSFDKETVTHLEARLDIPSIGLEAAVWQNTTLDKLYYGYDRDASGLYTIMPLQYSGTLSVTGAYLMKNFKFGILNLNHRVLIQKSSNEQVVSLPLATAYASWFLDFTAVRNVLQLQIGIGGWYNTEYYAPGYNPAIMQFHNQNFQKTDDGSTYVDAPIKIGNSPYLDAFVTAKWKRMRVLAKFQNVSDGIFGNPDFFGALHYPLNRRMFKLGFSWSFYD